MRVFLTHMNLQVMDMDKSIAFYEQWCGMKVVHQHDSDTPDQPVTWMASPDQDDDFVLVLAPGRTQKCNQKGAELEHLGFSVETLDDVTEMARRGVEAGILHWDVIDGGEKFGVICGVYDPDGRIIEFSFGQPLGQNYKAQNNRKLEP